MRHEWETLHAWYMNAIITALRHREIGVIESWIGPCHPREWTIVLAVQSFEPPLPFAVVWDEVGGCRYGDLVRGDPWDHSQLRHQFFICGCLVPDPIEVAETVEWIAVSRRRYWLWRMGFGPRIGWRRQAPFRSHLDRDDLDELLAAYRPPHPG